MRRTEVLPLVIADMAGRVAKGTAEYGEPLTTHNGRDALQDAYEEAMDLAMYLKQAILERSKPDGCIHNWHRYPQVYGGELIICDECGVVGHAV